MTPRRLAAGPVAAALLALGLLSCAGRVAPGALRPEPPARTASLDQLLDRLRSLGAPWTGFTADADLSFEDLRRGTTREVRLRLAGRKPDHLRIQGTRALLPTLFLVVANPAGTWVDVPSRHKTYFLAPGAEPASTEGVAAAAAAFAPGDFLRCLVPDPPGEDEQWWVEEEPGAYVLSSYHRTPTGVEPARRLTFERQGLGLTSLRLYAAGGRLASVCGYAPAAVESTLAGRVRVERPFDRIALGLSFRSARQGQPADPVFAFEAPAGRQLLDLAAPPEAKPEALPLGSEEGK